MSARAARRNAPQELEAIERLVDIAGARVQARVACRVAVDGHDFPVPLITLGNPDPAVPALAVVAGVHGLERIGVSLAIDWLRSVVVRLRWDAALHRQLESLRLVFMPLVNPGGLWRGTRSNPRGVDLMRNAPVDSAERVPPLLGGHRISPWLPWYRGRAGAPMEPEAQALCDAMQAELAPRPFALSIDCHSGFGLEDRVWFPHAHTRRPPAHLPELLALADLLDETLPQHRYVVEPQSRQYLAHGDLWDWLYGQACTRSGGPLLPLTLELGSWLWVKKNPRQALSRDGLFNPLIVHREARVMRRHALLFDFLLRAAAGHAAWRPASPAARAALHERALARWYRRPAR